MAMQGSLAGLKTTGDVQARKAATSAFFGFFVDMFDVFLPAIVLAPAYIYFQPPNVPSTVAAVAATLVLPATLLGRPLGSVVFGYLSDQIGRKPITMIAVSGFGVCTILMGMLPGYSTWGPVDLYLLICCASSAAYFSAANTPRRMCSPWKQRQRRSEASTPDLSSRDIPSPTS